MYHGIFIFTAFGAKGPSKHHAIGSFAPLALPVCDGHSTSETPLGLHLYSNLLPLKEIGPQEVPQRDSWCVCIYIYGGIYTHIVILYIQISAHMIIYIYIMYIHEYMWDSLPEAFPNPTLSQQKWEPFCQFAARSDAEIGT